MNNSTTWTLVIILFMIGGFFALLEKIKNKRDLQKKEKELEKTEKEIEELKKSIQNDNTDENIKCNGFPYHKRDYLFTYKEFNFYRKLKIITDSKKLILCPKVRLADLIEVNENIEIGLKRGYFAKIMGKHIDFVICTDKLKPLLLIELDDQTHLNEARKKRDKFIDNAVTASNLSIYHAINDSKMQMEIINREIDKVIMTL